MGAQNGLINGSTTSKEIYTLNNFVEDCSKAVEDAENSSLKNNATWWKSIVQPIVVFLLSACTLFTAFLSPRVRNAFMIKDPIKTTAQELCSIYKKMIQERGALDPECIQESPKQGPKS